MLSKVKVIAEAGVNHNGSLSKACEMIEAAKKCNADIIKFQLFKTEKIVSQFAEKADYQKISGKQSESQMDMLRSLELTSADHRVLFDLCSQLDIEYLSTAFDLENLKFLVNELGANYMKIPSGDLTNAPLLLEHSRLCSIKAVKKIYLSTGMATLADIEKALGVLAFGFIDVSNSHPTRQDFEEAYISTEGQAYLKDKVCLLHCTSEYPAPNNEVNMRSMVSMGNAFNLGVGFSDHTAGDVSAITAIALGAQVIEKHFTLDRRMEGPDHKASLDVDQLSNFIDTLRECEVILGRSVKGPTASEIKNMNSVRRSLIARRNINSGSVYTTDDLTVLRPGSGVSPYEYWDYLGQVATADYKAGDLISRK